MLKQLFGECLEPPAHRCLLSSLAHRRDRQFDQVGGSLDILAGHRMVDRLGSFTARLVPSARPAVQLMDTVGLLGVRGGRLAMEDLVPPTGWVPIGRDPPACWRGGTLVGW